MKINTPLYNFIVDVLNPEELLQYKLDKKLSEDKSRSYYLMHIDQNHPILPTPYDTYELKDTHFSIDEFYLSNLNRQDGLTPIHYTQIYSMEGKDDIFVHVYLTNEGEYIYHKIPDDITLTPDQKSALEQKLKDNLKDALPQLEALITKFNHHKANLKKQANQLNKELTQLTRNLTPKNRREYIQKGHQFIDLIEQFNRYSLEDEKDKRSRPVSSIVKTLEAISLYSSGKTLEIKSEKNHSSEDTQEQESSKPTAAQLLPKEKVIELYGESLSQLYEQFKVFTETDPERAPSESEKTQISKNLQDLLFLIYNFEDTISQKDKNISVQNNNIPQNFIQKINTELKKFEEKQIKRLKILAFTGSLDAFKELYPLYLDSIQPEFYEALINNLIEKPWNPIQEKALEVLNYLNEVDPHYKNYILQASKEFKYRLSPRAVAIFSKNSKTDAKSLEESDISLLFKVYSEDKLALFDTLLSHGADAQTWGIFIPQKEGTLSLFYSIIYLNEPIYLEYLKILMRFNADPNSIHSKDLIREHNQNNLKLKVIQSKKNRVKPKLVLIDGYETPLNLLSKQSGIEGIHIVQSKISLTNLAFHLSWLIHNHNMAVRNFLILTNQNNIIFKSTKESAVKEANMLIAQTAFLPDSCKSYTTYVLYPAQQDCEEIQKLYKKIELTQKILSSGLSNLSEETFDKLYESLFLEAEATLYNTLLNEKQRQKRAYLKFLGCEILLINYAQQKFGGDLGKQNKFISKKSSSLYRNIISLLNKDVTDNKSGFIEYYAKAKKSFEIPFQYPAPLIIERPKPENTFQLTSLDPAFKHKGPPI